MSEKRKTPGRPPKNASGTQISFGTSLAPDLYSQVKSDVKLGRWESMSAALNEITRVFYQEQEKTA